jgi:uncharacterized protein
VSAQFRSVSFLMNVPLLLTVLSWVLHAAGLRSDVCREKMVALPDFERWDDDVPSEAAYDAPSIADAGHASARKPMRNVEIIQELYRCFRERDDEGFRRICADDVEWIQNVGFPHGAVRVGADAVIEEVFRGNRSEWDGFAYHIEQMLDAGASVVVIGRYEGRHHVTQKPMQATAAHVYDLKDGKVSRFRMFADTKPMWDAMT